MTLYELDSTATNSNTVTNNELGGGAKGFGLGVFYSAVSTFSGKY